MSRNVLKYPITKEEVLIALDYAIQKEDDDDQVGGLNAYILQKVYEVIDRDFDHDDFNLK